MPKVKPGWYVLAAVTLYAVLVTVLLFTREEPSQAPSAAGTATAQPAGEGPQGGAPAAGPPAVGSATTTGSAARDDDATTASGGLWYPIPGVRLPTDDANLPGAPRPYRSGVSQGFDFHDGDVAVPVPYGAAVIAAAAGQVIRADNSYVEMEPGVWELLLEDVTAGASDEELDRLRGRQVWLQTPQGTVLRYGHLAGIASGIAVGRSVYRGQVIGYVGNSGTDDGVAGNRDGARLRFEIWDEDGAFFGEGAAADEVRLSAASLFVGP